MKRLALTAAALLLSAQAWAWSGVMSGVLGMSTAGGPAANDTFTDTDSTALASHTSDSAHTWTQNGGGGLQIYGNRVESTQSTSAGLYYSSYTPSDADYSVSMVLTSVGSAVPPHPIVRGSTSAMTGYSIRWDGDGNWVLRKWVSGTPSTLGTYTGDSPVDSPRTVKLTVSGSATTSLAVTIGGVSRITADDSSSPITAAGRPGIATYYCGVPASHTFYADSWEVTE